MPRRERHRELARRRKRREKRKKLRARGLIESPAVTGKERERKRPKRASRGAEIPLEKQKEEPGRESAGEEGTQEETTPIPPEPASSEG